MFLRGPGFVRKEWQDAFLKAYVEEPGSVLTPLSALSHQMSGLDEDLNTDHFWLHPAGGIRGVSVKQPEEGMVEMSLPLGANRKDFDFAWDLMRLGVKHGAQPSDEERDSLTMEDAEIEEISRQQLDFYWSTLISRVGEGFTLPVGGFLALKVQPEDGAGGVEGLEAILVERMNRYSTAYVATLMIERGGTEERILSNYGQIPSLIHERARFIATQGEGGAVIEELIPADHFYATLGPRVEPLGEWTYVPAIDFSAEPELVETLRGRTGMQGIPKPSIVTQPTQQGFTDEEWDLLGRAPCLVFILVAAADGGIDRKEIASFGSILQKQDDGLSPVFSRILDYTRNNLEAILEAITKSALAAPECLLRIGLLLKSERISRQEALMVAVRLCELGKAIASASGGGLFGFGSKISKQEAQALSFLEQLLINCAMPSNER